MNMLRHKRVVCMTFTDNYDVSKYLGVEGFALIIWQVNINGFINFNGSSYL